MDVAAIPAPGLPAKAGCLFLALALAVTAARAATGDGSTVQMIKDEVSMASNPEPSMQVKQLSGWYEPLGMAPIAVAHALQLPCGNKFLMIEFGPTGREGQLMLPHPETNPKGYNILQVYDRDNDSWTDIPTDTNSVCGGWARLSNGQVGLFAGHYGTLEDKQVEGFKSIFVFDPTSYSLTEKANLTHKRWYPTTVTLPDGSVYIPGGTKPQMPNGVWPKAEGADIFSHAYNTVVKVKTNKQLHETGLGNWYMGAFVLPTGHLAVLNKNMMQVIDPYTGEALAVAPALPASVKDLVWEFPRMGPQVHLRAPIMQPGKDVKVEFVVFGGGWIDAQLAADLTQCSHVGCNRTESERKPCADVAVRMGLLVTADGDYKFESEWEVEKMPAPRCIADGILLPNGHVVIIGGQKVGLGDLTDSPSYNGGHEPYNEPWIYKPEAPVGRRFFKTGAKTRIARMYHATSTLTKDGDIVVGGSSNAGFWRSSHSSDFSRTPLPVNEYRVEVYHPPYLFDDNRPRITTPPPTFVLYGTSFEVGYGFDSPAAITGVVLVNAGGVTHNYAIGHRSQLLDFEANVEINATHGVLRVEAPTAPEYAPPSHYMLFLLRDDVYSQSAWVQLRKPLGKVPVDYPQEARLIPEMSTTFEANSKQPYKLMLSAGRKATCKFAAPVAKGTGSFGARITVTNGPPEGGTIRLQSGVKFIMAGEKCYIQLWARSSGKDSTIVGYFIQVPADEGADSATVTEKLAASYSLNEYKQDGNVLESQEFHLLQGGHCLHLMGPIEVTKTGQYVIQFDLGTAALGATIDIDDIEVYCV